VTARLKRAGILRAEVHADGLDEIACALELSEESVFVVTDALPPVGTRLMLRLSFPHAIEPIDVRGSVAQVRLASGPGTPSGFVAAPEPDDDTQRASLRALVERFSVPATPSSPASAPASASGAAPSTRSTAAPSAPPSGAQPAVPPVGREIRVLLVEDNRLIRDMFAYAVEKYFGPRAGNLRLDQAPDVETAWDLLEASSYDLVIVDYYLPNGDGASLITRLRSGGPALAGTSVVAISVGGSDVRRATLTAGADLFLHKPIALRDLFCTIEVLMQEGVDAGAA
jgi:CheY-like chemotaxis protein